MPLEYTRDKGRFADLSNGRIFYQWHGPDTGPVLVLVHGLSTPSFVWRDMLPKLVQAGFRVLTFDHFGRGFSEYPGQAQTSDFFVKELDELLNVLDVQDPVTLLGYSMGGGIVASFAALQPYRIGRLILLAPVGLRSNLGGFFKTLLLMPVLGDVLLGLFGPYRFRKGLRESARSEAVDAAMIDMQIAETRQPAFAAAVLSSLRHVVRTDLRPAYEKLAKSGLPILVIFGEKDAVIPISSAEILRQRIPQAQIVVVPEAGHGLAYTHAGQVTGAVLDFIRP